jgi:hypothetical protein
MSIIGTARRAFRRSIPARSPVWRIDGTYRDPRRRR